MLDMMHVPQVNARRTTAPRAHREVETEGWTAGALIEIVRRRIGIVAKVTAACIVVALVYFVFAVSRFTATASLVPDMKRTPPAPNEVSQETLIDPAIVENQIETIRSDRIALAVIDKLALWKDEEFVGKGPGLLVQALTAVKVLAPPDAASNDLKRRVAADNFARGLKVLRIGRSYLTEISFTSTDPAKAATIANAIADTYIQDQLGAKFSNAERSGRWMQERIGELGQQAAAAAKAIDDHKTRNNLNLDAGGKPAIVREHEELTASLEQAKDETSRINTRLERTQSALRAEDPSALPDSGFLDTVEDATLARLLDEYRDAQRSLPPQSLEDRGRQPDDPAIASKLAEQRSAIWNAVRAGAEAAKKELEAAKLREATIARRLAEMAPGLEAMRKQLDKLSELESKYQGYQQLHDALQNRYARVNQFVQQQSIPVTEARIITEATPPLFRSSPKRTLILLLAAFAGGVLGVGSAIGREYFDRRVRRPEQIERDNGVRSLGTLQRFGRQVTLVRPNSTDNGTRTDGGTNESLLARRICHWLAGAAGETLRGVKVMLDDSVGSSHGRVLAIVSPQQGEGKSTIALALAMLAARAGKRVCLIDADIRDPSLTRALTPGATGGLVAAVALRTPFADRAVRHELGFHFLGQEPGFTASHPADILGSEAMHDMIEHLRSRYDYIFVDTPELLSYVDVGAAAGLFDAFLLIAEWGSTTIEEIDRSLASCAAFTERLLGVLINKSPAPKNWLRGTIGFVVGK